MSPSGNVKYNRRAALVLGILQVLCAVANIVIQIPIYVEDLLVIAIVSVGIWTGISFLITGILALVSVKKNTNRMITVVMVMCIVSSLAAAVGIILASLCLIFSTLTGNDYHGDTAYKYKIAEDVTIAHCVVCLCYGICAIVLSAFCCRAVCCGAREDMQLLYVTTSTVQPDDPQQATAYMYAVNTTSYPPAQASYPPPESYKPTQADQYAQNPHMGSVTQQEAPPTYAEKGQIG